MADPKGLLVVPVGFRVDSSIHALELDNSDRLKVLVDSITGNVTVVQTSVGNLVVVPYSHDGSAYHVLPSFTDGVIKASNVAKKENLGTGSAATASNLSLAAGTNNVNCSNVPAGHKHRIKFAIISYTGTVAGVVLQIILVIGGSGFAILRQTGITSGANYTIALDFPLEAGDNVRGQCQGATLNDDLTISYLYEDVS